MDIFEAINSRRSVRKYKNTEISKADLEQILNAACMAPSSKNTQPWYFVAVRDESEKSYILGIMQQVAAQMKAPLEEYFKEHPDVAAQTLSFIKSLGAASVYVLVFSQKPYDESSESALTQSIAAAVQNLCLAASGLGLGTCWMRAPINVGFAQTFKDRYAKDKGQMLAMLTLGVPDEAPKVPKRKDDRYKII